MNNKVGEIGELKSIDDHFDLLMKLMLSAQELPQGEQSNMMIDRLIDMSSSVIDSMGETIKVVLANSKKYRKKLKNGIKYRFKDWRENRRQRKFEDAQYKSYLEWQKSMFEKASSEPAEPPQDAEAGLPVCQPATSLEVVEEERQQD